MKSMLKLEHNCKFIQKRVLISSETPYTHNRYPARNYHYRNAMIKKINCSAKRHIFHDNIHNARSVLDIGSREGSR